MVSSLDGKQRPIELCLRRAWEFTTARLASLHIATPAPISISQPAGSAGWYIVKTTLASAPLSTVFMALATAIMTICNIAQSYVLGSVTENAISGQEGPVKTLLIVLIGLWLATPVMQCARHVFQIYSSQNIRIGVMDHLTARLMYAQPRILSEKTVGNVVERIEIAAESMHCFVDTVATTAVKLLSVSLAMTVVLSNISAPFAIVCGAWMVSAIALSAYLALTGMRIVEDASDAHARVISELAELITNVSLIRSFATQCFERSRFGVSLHADLRACRRVRSYWLFVLLIESLYKWGFGALVTSYVAAQYLQGAISVAELVTVFSLVIGLSWHFESVAFHFVEMFEYLGEIRASLGELNQVPIEIESGTSISSLPCPGRIYLRNCTAAYEHAVALKNVSLQIEPGTKVGIVGPSGSGKSTLLGVVRGEIPCSPGGEVEIHGLALSDHSHRSLAPAFSEASQSALMFNRTLVENVRYGSPHASSDDLGVALRAARALSLVAGLPKGLESKVGERGSNISTGERQRLAIARALIKRAPLLILDEATSSVDALSEAAIFAYVRTQLPNCTVLAVSHRIASLADFDQIVVIDKGRIVDVGSPSELIARCELYRQLSITGDAIA